MPSFCPSFPSRALIGWGGGRVSGGVNAARQVKREKAEGRPIAGQEVASSCLRRAGPSSGRPLWFPGLRSVAAERQTDRQTDGRREREGGKKREGERQKDSEDERRD